MLKQKWTNPQNVLDSSADNDDTGEPETAADSDSTSEQESSDSEAEDETELSGRNNYCRQALVYWWEMEENLERNQ